MKSTPFTFSALLLGLSMPVIAQVTETTTETEVTRSSNGRVEETTKTTVTTFNPEIRTKVVEYFDAHKAAPHGLPPAFISKIKVEEIPAAWKTSRIEPGVVVTEQHRPYLVAAPPELVKVLPAPPSPEIRYYVAGSNVVAVNKTYQVVDSIQIPTVKFQVAE